MTFKAFRDWTLTAATRAALRWEDPTADEMPIMYGQDRYGDLHEVAVPPIYLVRKRGHIGWMTQLLPAEVANRTLYRLAFRASAWTGDPDKYEDLAADPARTELLIIVLAEQGRREVWQARINRDKDRLPRLGSWERCNTNSSEGPLLPPIEDALRFGKTKRGRTMPAANMVLGPYDVPRDYFPDYRGNACGPVDWVAQDQVIASYKAAFRPEKPDHVILSVCYVFSRGYGVADHMHGAIGALIRAGNKEITGPRIGERSHLFAGPVDDGRLHKYQALWKAGNILCELALLGPPGHFKADELITLVAGQDVRLRAELRAPLKSAH
jgi:hypothetical protein